MVAWVDNFGLALGLISEVIHKHEEDVEDIAFCELRIVIEDFAEILGGLGRGGAKLTQKVW